MARSGFRAWAAYQKSFHLASSIYRMSQSFPKEERYSLTDQIRRSSRSVTANLAESYGRRQYRKYFLAKLADCVSENFETQAWCDFAHDAGYLSAEEYKKYLAASEEVGKLLTYMQKQPERFQVKQID